MVSTGYVKLWRQSAESAVFADPILWKLWCLCLMKANYKINFVDIDGIAKPVKVMPGQFITGRFALHKEMYPIKKKNQKSPSTVWNKLQVLENMQNLNIRSHAKYSIITICNWNEYQQNEQQANNRLTTGEQQANTDKKDKKDKKGKEKTYTADFLDFWEAYPNKVGKTACWRKWKTLNGNRPNIETILSAIKNQRESQKWKSGYIPNPLTWLNQGRWEDETMEVEEDALTRRIKQLEKDERAAASGGMVS